MENLFYIVDSDIGYKKIGTLDKYVKTFNWTEEMMGEGDGGTFEIILTGGKLAPILKKELFIINTKTFKIGFITTIKYKKYRGEILEITISGKMAEHILTRRVIKKQMQLKGTIDKIISDIIKVNVISTHSSVLNIPMEIVFDNYISPDEYDYGFEAGEKVSEALKTICTNLNMMYYFKIENNTLVLHIKKTEDKSYIMFASEDTNLYDNTIVDTIEDKANCAIVQGDIINNSVPYVYVTLKGSTGLHVIETFVDKSNLDSKDVESSIYLNMMKNNGTRELISYQIRKAFDAAAIDNKYHYPHELSLGDTVSVSIDGVKEEQRITSFLHMMNSNNKEEIIFTLTQLPQLITAENEVVMEEIPPEQRPEVETDATTENANPNGSGGGISGQPVKIVGHILCIDNDKIRGTVQELEKDVYRVNIYAWNDNKTVTTTNEDGTEITSQQICPYSGKIYVPCDIDLLSKITNTTRTIDIDNFDGSKTRINVDNARRGVLFIDKADLEGPPLFEMPTEANADKQMCWEYDIESENLNFNVSFIISEKPVKYTIPTKMYSKSYPTLLRNSALYFKFNIYKNYATYYSDFSPTNFFADEGDYIHMVVKYAPIHHVMEGGKTVFRWYAAEETIKTIRFEFKNGEMVADKRIRWEEGFYSFYKIGTADDELGYHSSFKKLKYINTANSANDKNAGFIGTTEFRCCDRDTNATYDMYTVSHLGFLIIKMDPAFDIVDNLTDVTWICKLMTNTTFYSNKIFDGADWQTCNKFPYFSICTDVSKSNDGNTKPMKYLEKLCEDPSVWQKILDEEAAAAADGETTE